MGGPAYQEALVEILARQKRIATSAVEHFRVQELGAEYEKGRAAVIVRENRINLQGYEDLWQWCRCKRNMDSGWWPKQAVAWGTIAPVCAAHLLFHYNRRRHPRRPLRPYTDKKLRPSPGGRWARETKARKKSRV